MRKDENLLRYDAAAAILPNRLRRLALAVAKDDRAAAEEFRLRAGRAMTVLLPDGEKELDAVVEPKELEMLCDLATEFSRYAAAESLRQGFVPVRGGFRVGLCGRASVEGGKLMGVYDVSSVNIRIPHATRSLGEPICKLLRQHREGKGVLI